MCPNLVHIWHCSLFLFIELLFPWLHDFHLGPFWFWLLGLFCLGLFEARFTEGKEPSRLIILLSVRVSWFNKRVVISWIEGELVRAVIIETINSNYDPNPTRIYKIWSSWDIGLAIDAKASTHYCIFIKYFLGGIDSFFMLWSLLLYYTVWARFRAAKILYEVDQISLVEVHMEPKSQDEICRSWRF